MKVNKELLDKIKKLGLPEKEEKNPHLLLHVHGDGIKASKKFNVKIYKNKEGKLTLVTNDEETLQRLLRNERPKKKERTIVIDDSGVGFPLGGALVGVYDTKTGKILSDEVGVEFFQGEKFEKKLYCAEYAKKAVGLVQRLGADPKDTKIVICTGYINTKAKELLRKKGFQVEVGEIGEPLQSELEKLHADYISSLGYGQYFDPKEVSRSELGKRFEAVVEWIKNNNKMHLAKTGWKYFQRE
ncbi:MAG: hypothetical protein ACE5J5_00250 [Candidatus Hydrothermarchaeales archaeon]